MKKIIILMLVNSIFACEKLWSCEKCIEGGCKYIVQASEGFCVANKDEVIGKRRVITSIVACKFVASYKTKTGNFNLEFLCNICMLITL